MEFRDTTDHERAALHFSIQTVLDDHLKDLGPRSWGWPGGSGTLPHTYLFPATRGPLLIAPNDLDSRWWLGFALEDAMTDHQIAPQFELNIPKKGTNRLSLRYLSVGENCIAAMHTGTFTVGNYGSVRREEFFEYYDSAPGRWPILRSDGVPRVHLFTFDMDHFSYEQAHSFLTNMADFADYVTFYKDAIRDRRSS